MKDFKKTSKKAAKEISNKSSEQLRGERQQFFDNLEDNEKCGDIVDNYRVASIRGEYKKS